MSQLSGALKKNVFKHWPVLVGIVVLILALTGVYSVGPGEVGVVRTFGKYAHETGPGLHYAIPIAQSKDVVNMEQIRRIEVGFRGDQRMPDEALMLTGDENIVEAQMIVQYRVDDPVKYLFRINDPEDALHASAEVALRGVVGRTGIDDVITIGRGQIEAETKELLQELMTDYQSGLLITEVKLQVADAPDEVREAFHDVVRAREDKEKLKNQAEAYAADLLPRANGEAAQIRKAAEAYREKRILESEGDSARFNRQREEYEKAKRVTRQRIYLETVERILSKLDKTVIVDGDVAGGALPVLPLGPGLGGGAAPAPQGGN